MSVVNVRKIEKEGQTRIALFFKYQRDIADRVKSIPNRKYSRSLKCWHLPYTSESWRHLKNTNLELIIDEEKSIAIDRKLRYDESAIDEYWMEKLEGFEKYLEIIRYRDATIRSYMAVMKLFLAWVCKHGITVWNLSTLEAFNHEYFIQGKHSKSYQNIWASAIKLFLDKYTEFHINVKEIERPRTSKVLPNVLSTEEIKRLLNSYRNLKHKAIIMTIYACGLRKSELINLKLSDLDGKRNVIRIRNSKGAKDRDISFPKALKKLLKVYYKQYKPREYLFNGQDQLQYSGSSISKLLKAGIKRSGIDKHVTPHSLRHSYATHLVEKNINLRYIQEALGHKSSKTTEIYTYLSKENIGNMTSPVDFWDD